MRAIGVRRRSVRSCSGENLARQILVKAKNSRSHGRDSPAILVGAQILDRFDLISTIQISPGSFHRSARRPRAAAIR